MQQEIQERYERIAERIEKARQSRGGSSSVSLCAVSKRQPIERVQAYCEIYRDLHKDSPILGENYVQEYREKRELLPKHVAHLIGPLQTNKAKDALSLFDTIQSVHSMKLLRELQKRASAIEKRISVFLQINISDDAAKSGFRSSEFPSILEEWAEHYPNLVLEGAMTITTLYQSPSDARHDFARFAKLVSDGFDCFSSIFAGDYPQISMGMSGDFEEAILEGATLVRIGSALFGART